MNKKMTFEEANDIIERRYCYRMADIPTVEEVEEAEKAFGIKEGDLCDSCVRYDVCSMEGPDKVYCNFFTEEKK